MTPQFSAAGVDWAGLNLVGESASMLKLRERIELFSKSDHSVLILGERGTGKECVARAIHGLSSRKIGPLVAVAAGAISETLFESEMFGHAKGAFTDAKVDKPGHVERANRGVLFLDELTRIRIGSQAKLLRVIQERQITRVGETIPRPVDFRLITATNELKQAMEDERLLEDFYDRIRVLVVEVPPLRDRTEDIIPLAEHFLKGSPIAFHPDALEFLRKHSWPGNVRQLEHAVYAARVYCKNNTITVEDLMEALRDPARDSQGSQFVDERARCANAVAAVTNSLLAEQKDPSEGFKRGGRLGPLAGTVVEGMAEGLRLFLNTDQGVQLCDHPDREILSRLGVGGRAGNPSALLGELERQAKDVIAETKTSRSQE